MLPPAVATQFFTSVRLLPSGWQPRGITRELHLPVIITCNGAGGSSTASSGASLPPKPATVRSRQNAGTDFGDDAQQQQQDSSDIIGTLEYDGDDDSSTAGRLAPPQPPVWLRGPWPPPPPPPQQLSSFERAAAYEAHERLDAGSA